MPDPHQIVDDIRAFLASNDQTKTPALAELAAGYAAACREANDRLRRCADFLKQGLRTEAIATADQPPNLMELVGALDLPEIADWEEICGGYDLPRAPRLLLDIAAALNEAYAAEQPLQSLLYTHRLLGLAKAPVRDRLGVLRLLAQQDPTNPVWAEDIPAFEAERIKELKYESVVAVRKADHAFVDQLWAEVASPDWRTAVPQELHDFLADTAAQYQRQETVAKLKELLPKLNAAYGAMSYDECVSLLGQWSPLAANAGSDLPAEMAEHAQAAADWVTAEDERRRVEADFQAACGALSDAIDRDLPEASLTGLHVVAAGMGRALPPELQERYDARLLEFDTARRRRKIRIRIGAAAAVVVVVAFVAFLILRKIEGDKIDRYRVELHVLLDQDRMAEADSFLKRCEDEGFAEHFRAEREKVDRIVSMERQRAEDYQVQVKAAIAAGTGQPNEEAIRRAENLAKTAQERLEVAEIRSKVEQAKRERAEQYDKDYAQRVGALVDEMAALAVDWPSADLAAIERKQREWAVRYAELDQDARVSAVAKAQSPLARISQTVKKLEEGFRAERQRRTMASEERTLLDGIAASGASAKSLVDAINGYLARFPDTERAKQMKIALGQEDAWRAMEAWVAVAPAKLMPADVQGLEAQVKATTRYSEQHPKSPMAKPLADYIAYLKQAQMAVKPDGPWDSRLGHVLQRSQLIRGMYAIRSANKTYYTRSDEKGKRVSIANVVTHYEYDVILTRDVTETKREKLPADVTDPQPKSSPQWVLADDVLKPLERRSQKLASGDWDLLGLDVIAMIRDRADVDPIMRVLLLQSALKAAAETSPGIEQTLKLALGQLETLRAEDINFMNPFLSGPERAQAERILTNLVALDQERARVQSRRQAVLAGVAVRLSGSGVLLRDAAGWQVCTRTEATDGMRLMVATRSDPAEAYGLRHIGQATSGKWQLDNAATGGLVEGQMVFICQTRP